MVHPGRLFAFVLTKLDHGPVLGADLAFHDVVREGKWALETMCDMPLANEYGMMIFEGWVEEEDDGKRLVGEWRRLTHWEMCRARLGFVPWG